jgi:hypothetical protein
VETLDASSVIREQLGREEHLLWAGQPGQGIRLRPTDLYLIPFSLLWGGFAFFWEWSVVTGGAPFFFKLWGIPFVGAGAYLILGRFFWDAYRRSQTYCGLSDQRALIVTRGLSPTTKSFPLVTLPVITLSLSRDGSGTIQFGTAAGTAGAGRPGFGTVAPAFEMIEDARDVHDRLLSAQKAATQPKEAR